ncbi:hypothetical protein GCM10020331_046900 [Ectobacillus funiculus]
MAINLIWPLWERWLRAVQAWGGCDWHWYEDSDGTNREYAAKTLRKPRPRYKEGWSSLGKFLIVIALALTALVVLVGVYQGNNVYHMFF